MAGMASLRALCRHGEECSDKGSRPCIIASATAYNPGALLRQSFHTMPITAHRA